MARSYGASGRFGTVWVCETGSRTYGTSATVISETTVDIVAPSPSETWDTDQSGYVDFSNLDKTATVSTDSGYAISAARWDSTGQYYVEVTIDDIVDDTDLYIGVSNVTEGGNAETYWWDSIGFQSGPSSTVVGDYPAFAIGDVIGIASDLNDGKLWFRKNGGTWNPGVASADPEAGTGYIPLEETDGYFGIIVSGQAGTVFILNTGPSFDDAAPTGFYPWYAEVYGVDVDVTGESVTAEVGTVSATGYTGGEWTPASISADLFAWIRADIIAGSDGSAQDTLSDSGPDGHNFTKMGSNGPVLRHSQLDGKSILEFFTTSKAVFNNASSSFTNFGVYFVYKGVSTSGYLRIVDHHYANGFYVASGVSSNLIGGGVIEGSTPPYGHWITASPTSWTIISFERIGTTKKLRKNGGTVSDTDRTVSGSSTTPDYVSIGGDNAGGGNYPVDLQLAELIILDANISTDSRNLIEGYLAWKWGLEGSLDAGHPYKSSPPGGAGDVDVTLTTNSAEAQVGTVTVNTKANVTLTTNSATASVLSVTADGKVNVTLTTNSATASVLSVTASVSYNAALTTNSASVFVQDVSFTGQAKVTQTTNSATASVQDVSVSTKANVSLTTSGSAEVQVGTVTVDVPVEAAFELVQFASGTETSTPTSLSFSAAPTAGNLIVLGIIGNTYMIHADAGWFQATETRLSYGTYLWWRISDGSNPVGTYSLDVSSRSAWVMAEFSGGADQIDAFAMDYVGPTGSGASMPTPSLVPSTGERLVIGLIGTGLEGDLTGNFTSWTNGFTAIDTVGHGPTTHVQNVVIGLAYKVITGDGSTSFSTAATYSPGLTFAAGGASAIASLKNVGSLIGNLPPDFRSYDHITYGSRTNTTVSKPSGTVADDILIASFFQGFGASTLPDVTAPSGFQFLTTTPQIVSDGGFFGRFIVYWKRAGGSEPSSYTWTHGTSSTQCVLSAWSGCITDDIPIDGFSYNFSNTGTTFYWPAISPRQTNTKLIVTGQEWVGDPSDNIGPSWTEHYDDTLIKLWSRDMPTRGDTTAIFTNDLEAPHSGYMLALRGPESLSDIDQVGTTLQYGVNNTAATGTVSSTITVPTGAEIVLVGLAGYREPADYLKNMTFTKGGVDTPMMRVPGYRQTNIWQGELFYLVLPDVGTNKSLKWDFIDGTYEDANMNFSLTFWRGVDTDFPVGTSFNKPWIVGGSRPLPMVQDITAVSGDKVVAWCSAYNSAQDGTASVSAWTNLTNLADPAHQAHAEGAWAIGDPSTGTTSVGITSVTNTSQGILAALVLRQAGSDVPKLSHVAGSAVKGNGTTSIPVVSNIVTMRPNSLYVVVGTALCGQGEDADATISDSEGLTWTQQLREANADSNGWESAVYIWTAVTGSSPDPTTLTVTWSSFGGQTEGGYAFDLFEATEANLSTPILQTFTDGSGNSSGLTGAYNGDFASATESSSVILAAAAVNSVYDHGAVSQGSGWDQRVEVSQEYSFHSIQTHDGGSTNIDWAWMDPDGNYSWAVGAVEIAFEVTGAVDVYVTTNSVTAEAGTNTLKLDNRLSVTTNSAEAQAGTATVVLGSGVSISLTTNSVEAQYGTNTLKLDNRLSVTTNSAEAYAGTVIAQTAGTATVAASSQFVEAQAGDVTIRGKANVTQTTNSVSVPSPNNVTVTTGVGISETTNSVEAQVGSVTVIAIGGFVDVTLTTNSAEVQVGTVSVALPRTVTLTTPNALTASVNKVTVPVNLTGNSITASVGTALALQSVQIELEGMSLFIPELSEEEGFIVESDNNLFVTGEQAAIIQVGSVEVSGSTIIEEELRFAGQEVSVSLGSISLVLTHNITLDSMPISVELGRAFSTNWGTTDQEAVEKWTNAEAPVSEDWTQEDRVTLSHDGWTRIIGHG